MAKRGRPAGKSSFVRVDLKTLNDLFRSQHHIPVSSVWLREQGYELTDSAPVPVQISQTQREPEEKVEMTFSV